MPKEIRSDLGALLLGLVAGFIGRALVPNDVFENPSGPTSWLASIVLGLVGAAVGWLIFTAAVGIGDTDAFDWGGIVARSSAWSSSCWSRAS